MSMLHHDALGVAARGGSGRQAAAHTFSPRRLIPATGVALAVSIGGVLGIRALAVSGTANISRFTPLHPSGVISLTTMALILACATCLLLNRTSKRPLAAFRTIALVVLPLSFIPDAAIWLTRVYPQTRAATVLPLIAMHILVASVCLVILPRLGRGVVDA